MTENPDIINVSNENLEKKLIMPNIRGKHGSIAHFHHFFAGYYLPILFNEPMDSGIEYTVCSCGPMRKIWLNTPKYKFNAIPRKCINPKNFTSKVKYYGYDGPGTPGRKWTSASILELRKKIFDIYDVVPENLPSSGVVIINRGTAPKKRIHKTYAKKRGASRRTIVNIDWLTEEVSKYYDAQNVLMESLTMKQQIELFASASAIIGDHGSALTHLLWCKPETPVIELVPRHHQKEVWFKRMTRLVNLQHSQIRNRVHSPADTYAVGKELTHLLHKTLKPS